MEEKKKAQIAQDKESKIHAQGKTKAAQEAIEIAAAKGEQPIAQGSIG